MYLHDINESNVNISIKLHLDIIYLAYIGAEVMTPQSVATVHYQLLCLRLKMAQCIHVADGYNFFRWSVEKKI